MIEIVVTQASSGPFLANPTGLIYFGGAGTVSERDFRSATGRPRLGRVLDHLALFAIALVPLGPLTTLGARRRGDRWVVAVLAGLVFPLTWVHWYLSDELPARRGAGRAGA
jgi:hypothetical protein